MNKTEVLGRLKKLGSKGALAGMARYGLVSKRAYGISVGALKKLAKEIGTDHALARQLWVSGWYEARLLAPMIGDPAKVTSAEMKAWTAHFENWGDVDTVCFVLWDRSPLAWDKARQWSASPREWVKRAGFVLMACLALHDKKAPDKRLAAFLPLIAKGARDDRNFVKKGVSWALRAIGGRSQALNTAAVAVSERLAKSEEAAARWVGKDALRDLTSPKRRAALARKRVSSSRP